MTTYQQLEEELATDLIDAYPQLTNQDAEAEGITVASGMMPDLIALIDALPYFGDPAWNNAFRGALSNLAAANLANDKIAPQPFEYGLGYSITYSYNGPYSGYRSAFFTGLSLSAAAAEARRQMVAVNPGMQDFWWGLYGLVLLTDAVRAKVSVPVDSAKLTSSLASFNAAVLPTLSAAYLAVIKTGFPATTAIYDKIVAAGKAANAAAELAQSVQSAAFIANSNEAMSMGGDSTNAATWFLYNNWILLKLLGADVDAVISSAKTAGLNVPAEIGPGVWWSGGAKGYTGWYVALSGADVLPLTGSRIIDAMPEQYTIIASGSGWHVIADTSVKNGYSASLTEWGPLASYKPPPSSCLGAGTGILMADLSVKPIEEVVPGDSVWTPDGAWIVALVESPPRSGRTLTGIVGLNISVTPGHPLRLADPDGPRYASAGAWILRDTTPTMTENGVAELELGTKLLAVSNGKLFGYSVEGLEDLKAPEDDMGRVYDLLLEDWERHRPAFFAGGPDTFVAIEAESSNPLREPPSTLALLTALEQTVPTSRTHVRTPATTLPGSINWLDFASALNRALQRGWAHDPSHALDKPPIPGPDFYMTDGAWEPHASMLEVYLLRRFARSWRRSLACGWRHSEIDRHPNDHLSVLVHDLEISGDIALAPDGRTEVSLALLDYGLDFNRIETLTAKARTDRRWHPRFDQVVNFGAQMLSPEATLHISLHHNETELARVHIPLPPDHVGQGATEYFLTAQDGTIPARVALDVRWSSAFQRRAEARRMADWSQLRTKATALALGENLGRDLAGLLRHPA